MNKIVVTLSLIALLAFSCKDKSTATPEVEKEKEEEVVLNEAPAITLEEKNKPVFFDYTSTGCPGCGSWGAPTHETIAKRLTSDIVPVAVHIKYGDPMITGASEAIAANRTGQRFTPQLWVNNENSMVLNGNSIDGNASIDRVNDGIEVFQSADATLAVGVSHAINDDEMTIRYKTKALEELDGEYWIGVYVMENGILHQQSSAAQNPFEHNYVIRVSNSGGFGDLLGDSGFALDSETDKTVTLTLNEEWNKDNLYATAIVWKKEGSNFIVVNANSDLVH